MVTSFQAGQRAEERGWTLVEYASSRRRTIWRGVEGLPKGGRERAVELPASVMYAFKAHRHLRGRFVFCHEDGQQLTEGTLKAPLRRALRAAGITREQGQSAGTTCGTPMGATLQ